MNAQVQPTIDEQEEIYFTSEVPLPVEIIKQQGDFMPVDKQTGETSESPIFKCDALIHDPNKVHPIFFQKYSRERMVLGQYLATPSMGYFLGKFETRLIFKQCTPAEFEQAKNKLVQQKTTWLTGLEMEVHSAEKAGKNGYNHEAYLLDPIRGIPVLMDCYNREKISSGVYQLNVDAIRLKGKLVLINKYVFMRDHKTPELDQITTPEIPSTYELEAEKAHIQALKENKQRSKA